jgi:hypothetical protein
VQLHIVDASFEAGPEPILSVGLWISDLLIALANGRDGIIGRIDPI